MIEMAGDLIAIKDVEGACGKFKAALKKCDNDPLHPNFVKGLAASDFYDMIIELMTELGCECSEIIAPIWHILR